MAKNSPGCPGLFLTCPRLEILPGAGGGGGAPQMFLTYPLLEILVLGRPEGERGAPNCS